MQRSSPDLRPKHRLWFKPPQWVPAILDVIPWLTIRLHPVVDDDVERLKQRTLANRYNQRPTWLDNLQRTLDAAVFATHSWPADIQDAEILKRLLSLNLQRAVSHGVRTG